MINNKKSQNLSLNIIVGFVIVAVVLIVVIVSFVTKFDEQSDKVDTLSGCGLENPLLFDRYSDVKTEDEVKSNEGFKGGDITCGEGYTHIKTVLTKTTGTGVDETKTYCCGKKINK